MTSHPGRALALAGTVVACALAAHTIVNLRYLRRPDPAAPDVDEPVSVLIPARNEADHVAETVRSAVAQTGVRDLEVIVLDDGSSDGTAEVAPTLVTDPVERDRLSVIRGADEPVPTGWLGKPWACERLARAAHGSVLVFVDADVSLAPDAVRSLVAVLRDNDFALVAPYPHQVSGSWLERLVQPLVTWSWAATMPLRWAERSHRPSLSAANGQLMVLDAATYRRVGGHGSVRGDVIEDVALMRVLKRAGAHTSTVDGSAVATCRMYDGPGALVDGYGKSLWSAFGGPAGTVGVVGLLVLAYVVPAAAALGARSARTRWIGIVGYAAGVASRAAVARRTGEPVLPDVLAQPASIVAFAVLNGISWSRHLRGANTWKGRPVVAVPRRADAEGSRA